MRLPRILTALCVGAGLALSGVVLQGIFRNPLVDPHIIGVTSGSAFGGTLAIFFGFSLYCLFCQHYFYLASARLPWFFYLASNLINAAC